MCAEPVPDQGEDVYVGSAGTEQDRRVTQALRVGELDLLALGGERSHAVHQPELVRRRIRRCEFRQCLLRQTGPSGGPDSLVHRQSRAEVRFGGRLA
jgi:hypothetical protein